MKSSELSIIKECPKRYEFTSYGFKSEGSNYLKKNIVSKDIIKAALKMSEADASHYLKTDAVKLLQKTLDEMVMPEVTRRVEIETLIELITRYVNYVFNKGLIVVGNGFTKDIKVPGSSSLLTTGYDIAYENDDVVELVKIKISKPKLTLNSRTQHTSPNYSMELYAIEQLGKELFPSRQVEASYHHLSSKDDKSDGLADFEDKKGKNIVTKTPNLVSDNEVADEIAKLLDMNKENLACNTDECFTCHFKTICQRKDSRVMTLEELSAIEKVQGDFGLTYNQKKAIRFEDGVLRINAGAGSGKTTVLALRFGELVCAGTDPKDILLITFTNKGAGEMKEKVKYWLDKEGVDTSEFAFNIKTFNSFGGDIISEHFKELGFSVKPVLLEKVQKYSIIMDILNDVPTMKGFNYKYPFMSFMKAKGVCVEISEIFDAIKVKNLNTVKKLANLARGYERQVLSMYKMFEARLMVEGYIEYQDQINLINNLINSDSPIMEAYDYEHVIVDEFQDSDPGQLDIVMFLSNQPSFQSLMIVGDDSQSIFGFRNTSQENILKFHTYFNHVDDIEMVDNFRSTPEILNLANKINDLNTKKINKQLVSRMSNGIAPALYISEDSNDTINRAIVSEIKRRTELGESPEKFAVIARTKKELLEIQDMFMSEGVPTLMAVPDLYLNNTAVVLGEKVSSFLENRYYTQGLFEYLYVKENGFEGLSHKEIKSIVIEKADEIENSIINSQLGEDDVKKAIFFAMMDDISDADAKKFYKEIKDMTFGEIREYLFKFVEYEDSKATDVPEGNFKAVTLITAHTSKGKEYDVVYNIISKYKLPKGYTLDEIEELRRLLFVSVTRAKRELKLFSNLKTNNPFKNLLEEKMINTISL